MANDVKLQEGHPVDENLRPIKVGGQSSALELAKHGNGGRINGDFEITGDYKGSVKDMHLDFVPVYAGMILGYTAIGESEIHSAYTLTTSFAVTDSDHKVAFIAPPSGNVEIMVQIWSDTFASNRNVYFALSDNSTYNSIGASYEVLVKYPDETDDSIIINHWKVSGLSAGTQYTYWLGAKISSTNGYLRWGGTSSARYVDFIMKATALPKEVFTG